MQQIATEFASLEFSNSNARCVFEELLKQTADAPKTALWC